MDINILKIRKVISYNNITVKLQKPMSEKMTSIKNQSKKIGQVPLFYLGKE